MRDKRLKTRHQLSVMGLRGQVCCYTIQPLVELYEGCMVVLKVSSCGIIAKVPLSMAMSTLFSSAKTAGPVANLVCTAAAFPFMAVCTPDPARTAPRTPR